MDILETAKEISRLSDIAKVATEKKQRIEKLNAYDHEETGTRGSMGLFFVEFGGGSVHTKLYIKSNELGDRVTRFFTLLFDEEIAESTMAIKKLLK